MSTVEINNNDESISMKRSTEKLLIDVAVLTLK